MRCDREIRVWIPGSFVPAILVLIISLGSAAAASEKQKTYPEEGKIFGVGFNQINRSKTYKVATNTRNYELDCGKRPFWPGSAPGDCGGDKKLQIGDVIHFRIQKGRAYIPVPPAVEPSGEQQLRILREELRTDTQAKPPEKAEEKPAEKQ